MSFSIPTMQSFLTPVTISSGYGVSPSLLMLHGETVVDSSANNWTLTNTSVTASSTQKKFGSNSLLFNGSSSNLGLPNNAAFSLSTYTVEAWIYVSSLASINGFYASQVGSMACLIGTNGSVGITDQAGSPNYSTAGLITTGSWIHLAVVNNAGITVYVNGSVALTQSAKNMTYGLIGSVQGFGAYFNGYMDEFRISNSAIYTSTFTPPTAAFA
jgi:hypothetical protein